MEKSNDIHTNHKLPYQRKEEKKICDLCADKIHEQQSVFLNKMDFNFKNKQMVMWL